MADVDSDELEILEQEFKWLISEEVNNALQQLLNILTECSRRLPLSIPGVESLVRAEKFLMSNTPQQQTSIISDQVKCVVTVSADTISQADVSIKLHKQPSPHRSMVQSDQPWKLQQVQDAANHLWQAVDTITTYLSTGIRCNSFNSCEKVLQILNKISGCLQRGRTCLLIPKKRTIDELQHSKNMKLFHPHLPNNVAVSFYIQSHKLVFAVYHIHKDHGQLQFEVHQAETSIPWLNEVLVFFTVAAQLCQQLKDKVAVFSQYSEVLEVTSL